MFSNASADAITHKPNKPCISLESFILLVAGDQWMVDDFYVWKPPGGLSEDFLTLRT